VVADRARFERFYRDNLARIVRACYLVVLDRPAAEEVAADAFTRHWSKWDQIRDDDHAGGYVFKTAMRLCARRKRSIGRQRGVPPNATQDPVGGRAAAGKHFARNLTDSPSSLTACRSIAGASRLGPGRNEGRFSGATLSLEFYRSGAEDAETLLVLHVGTPFTTSSSRSMIGSSSETMKATSEPLGDQIGPSKSGHPGQHRES
jgi:hypothetical protein